MRHSLVRASKALGTGVAACVIGASAALADVSVMGSWGGDEEAGFRELLDAFTQKTGIAVDYEGDREVTVLVKTRLAGGNPPDIAMIPRPGEIAALARDGAIIPLTDLVDEALIRENYGQGWIDIGTMDGKFVGLMAKANSKSTVWYKPASFAALGVEPPETWDELMAIADAYRADGQTPWSLGGLDGWTLTDWFENIYVRVAGPEKYRQLFVTHEIEWTDPSVVEAMEIFRQVVDPESKLAGGAEGALSTGFIDAFNLVLQDDPQAEMYYEGGFMSSFGAQNFPDLVCGTDYTHFVFPEIKPEWGKPIVGGGDFAVAFRDTPDVRAFVEFLTQPEGNTAWASAPRGAVISPNRNVPLDIYPPCTGLEAKALVEADIVVFDGSDLAPGAVGGDAMFVALQDFVAEPDTIGDILEFLEDAADNAY